MKCTGALSTCMSLVSCWWCYSLFASTAIVVASAQNNKNNNIPPNNNIIEAISICREKLKVDPHFPKMQHSLAQLLDSQISPPSSSIIEDSTISNSLDTELISEVLELYYSVGVPSPEVSEKRLPPPKIRFESLTRAGSIARDILHDANMAIFYYNLAIRLEGIHEQSLLAVFEIIMPLLLSSAVTSDTIPLMDAKGGEMIEISRDGSLENKSTMNQDNHLQTALDLCNFVSNKCPSESIVDEFKGATLRKMKQPLLAYESYHLAMEKSKKQYSSCENGIQVDVGNDQRYECISLLGNFIKTSILVSAAGRESGILNSDEQLRYLLKAGQHAYPYLSASQSNEFLGDDHVWESFKNQIVDLFNNMGIVEKKREAFNHAAIFFRKALEIKPNDGHALVQLASIEGSSDGVDNDIVSKAKELDPEYVSALFDGYSSRFESELVDVLEYKGHTLVYTALQSALSKIRKESSSIQQVIDLGCGTGLLGELVSNDIPSANVFGVDLSQRMVDISRERKSKSGGSVYMSVIVSDAAQFLSTMEDNSIDCVLASDVFIYVGDISSVLAESSRCLVDNGLVGFTIESYEDSGSDSGLKLLPSGRFGHSREYINEVATLKGFQVFSWEECILRKQGGKDVTGAAVILKKT